MTAPRPPPWVHNNTSHSSLLSGLEIGLPPGRHSPGPILPAPEARQSYINKELPPIPTPPPSHPALPPAIPSRNPRRFSWVSSNNSTGGGTTLPPRRSVSSSATSSRRPSPARPQPQPAQVPKTLQMLGHPALTIRTTTPSHPSKVHQLTGYDLASPASRRHLKSSLDSASSASSYYCDREASDVSPGSIIDSYSKWGSWAPIQDPISVPTQSEQPVIFLPAGTYSNSASRSEDLALHNHTATRSVSHHRHRTREAATAQPRRLDPTLDALIAQERRRFVHNSFTQDIWHTHRSPSLSPSSPLPSAPLRQHFITTPQRPPSRFSDTSSSPDTPNFVAGIRDSMLAHARNISRGPQTPRKQPEETEWAGSGSKEGAGKRKRDVGGTLGPRPGSGDRDYSGPGNSAGRGSWVFRSPLRKKMYTSAGAGAGSERQGKEEGRSDVVRRISDAFMHVGAVSVPSGGVVTGAAGYGAIGGEGRRKFSVGGGEEVGRGGAGERGIVIPDHNRRASGPDTPRPSGGGRGFMEYILQREALVRGRGRIGEVVGRAREKTRIRGREERRRERLKGTIRVIGPEGEERE